MAEDGRLAKTATIEEWLSKVVTLPCSVTLSDTGSHDNTASSYAGNSNLESGTTTGGRPVKIFSPEISKLLHRVIKLSPGGPR